MPRIEHIAVWTLDIDRLAAFYATYFGADIGPAYVNPVKGFTSRFLSFGDGARIELMQSSQLTLAASTPGQQRLGWTHLSIALDSEAAVDQLTERLRTDGHPILDGPRRTGDGYYESVTLDPDGNRIEISA